jgi:hypothetical protein
MADVSRSRTGVLTKARWLVEDLLDAISQPLMLLGLLVVTALLVLRLALGSTA